MSQPATPPALPSPSPMPIPGLQAMHVDTSTIHHLTPPLFPIPSPAPALQNKAMMAPISSGSVENTLATYTNIDNATLHGICQGLIVMIRIREASHLQKCQQLEDQVLQLENK